MIYSRVVNLFQLEACTRFLLDLCRFFGGSVSCVSKVLFSDFLQDLDTKVMGLLG